ncbi:DUF4386 domain-containing protein [Rhodalgimonas zhirmunskyi]|uniref:DUF4386 domain-containing protein n=1 Tax=Rhodalgimonas zhirmunskyi TaxID=2964767 RepID=A0AAJ1X5F8_9RHOB|nr:DUF4386 domain-containing protein [Rhodoalgimonas zhirmunskyi]MDQ2093534.1 DUF4386 domain-containing protein [Rhodoalgimonas zhirmunskyi]
MKHLSMGRWAGILYLGIIVAGLSGEAALRMPLIDWADGAATGGAIGAHVSLFRASMATDMAMAAMDVALAVVFYRLLRGVDEAAALMAMVFRLMQAALIAGGLMFLFAALQAVEAGADPLPHLAQHAVGYDLGLFFFGINSLIMAVLLPRAGVARGIGWGIALAGVVYLAGSVTRFLAPGWNAAMQPAYLIPVVAEVALMLWLLFGPRLRGDQPRKTQSRSSMS